MIYLRAVKIDSFVNSTLSLQKVGWELMSRTTLIRFLVKMYLNKCVVGIV